MTKLVKTPFADSGDKAVIPDTDAAGNVNWSQGFPADYSKNPDTDPSAKRIERDDFNGLLNFITSAIREIQVNGVAPFINAADNGGIAFAYGIGAIVKYNGAVYQSTSDNNSALPTDKTKWNLLNTGVVSGKLINIKVFTQSGVYVPTPGTKNIRVELQAGGGGSGSATGTATLSSAGQSGGAGGYTVSYLQIDDSQTAQIVVGKGGAASTAGGDTTFIGFNNNMSAGGGAGGINNSAGGGANVSLHSRGGQGGGASGGTLINGTGGSGTPSFVLTGRPSGGTGGNSHFSGGALGAGETGGPGVQAFYGAGAGGATVNMSATTQPGAKGGDGLIIVWEYS